MKQENKNNEKGSQVFFYPRIIREFEDDDEPMYWG
jgi:hypothetical protein